MRGKAMAAKEMGGKATGGKETGGKVTGGKETRVKEMGAKASGPKATGAQDNKETGRKGDMLVGEEMDNMVPSDMTAGQNMTEGAVDSGMGRTKNIFGSKHCLNKKCRGVT